MRKQIQTIFYIVLLTQAVNGSDIHDAVRSKKVADIARIIETRGPEAVNETLMGGVTPLHLAAALNSRGSAGLLISAGADINIKTKNGFTPLHWAASKDSLETAKLLVHMGADINAKTDKGITPLHWAANKNATNVVELLLRSGADINIRTTNGLKPLHWAVKTDAAASCSMLLFQAVSNDEEKGLLKENRHKNIDGTDWNRMVEEHRSDSLKAPHVSGHPTAKSGEPLILPLGREIEIPFEWIASLKIWFGKHEITNAQYKRYKASHKSMFRETYSLEGTNQPAVMVNWKDAKVYCAWLNRHYSDYLPAGYEFRLPLDREWIACAKCGQERVYPWGNRMPPAYGNYSDDTARKNLPEWNGIKHYNDGFTVSCDVDKSGANEWDIFGMAGNVWEWCEDCTTVISSIRFFMAAAGISMKNQC